MPETRFRIQWPDGQQADCYSPSSVVRQYFEPGQDYALEEFVTKARAALQLASDRVQAKYGSPCGLALGQLQEIEAVAQRFAQSDSRQLDQPPSNQGRVKMIRFLD